MLRPFARHKGVGLGEANKGRGGGAVEGWAAITLAANIVESYD